MEVMMSKAGHIHYYKAGLTFVFFPKGTQISMPLMYDPVSACTTHTQWTIYQILGE